MSTATKSAKLHGIILLSSETVSASFVIAVNGSLWDVTGSLNVRTREFTPELVDSFGIAQFAREVAKVTEDEFVAQLQNMVTKNLTWGA